MACLALARLINRKVLRITGPDCYSYLQGLLCNDLTYLYDPSKVPKKEHAITTSNVISTFMLNPQGRAICDLLIYRTPSTRNECHFMPPGKATEPDELLIECDSTLASGLANTLYGYRVRRKIALQTEENLSIWCLYPGFPIESSSSTPLKFTDSTSLVNLNSMLATKEIVSPGLTVVNDPRLSSLGMRIIVPKETTFESLKTSIQSFLNIDIKETTHKSYTKYRFALGVGEGPLDHPESNCFPLECNADFLGSVSYNKGCYLGQELTARIHYTGVVRKRLMPIILNMNTNCQELGTLPLVNGSEIVIEGTGKKVGLLRHVVKDRALALLRFELTLGDEVQLVHLGSKTKIATYKPFWWPI